MSDEIQLTDEQEEAAEAAWDKRAEEVSARKKAAQSQPAKPEDEEQGNV